MAELDKHPSQVITASPLAVLQRCADTLLRNNLVGLNKHPFGEYRPIIPLVEAAADIKRRMFGAGLISISIEIVEVRSRAKPYVDCTGLTAFGRRVLEEQGR